MRNFSGFPELRKFLKSLGESDIETYRENARSYIESAAFDPFRKEKFVAIINQIVEEDCGVTLGG